MKIEHTKTKTFGIFTKKIFLICAFCQYKKSAKYCKID